MTQGRDQLAIWPSRKTQGKQAGRLGVSSCAAKEAKRTYGARGQVSVACDTSAGIMFA